MAPSDATWAPVPEGSGFGLANLPYGVAVGVDGRPRVVARIGDHVVEVADAVSGEGHDLVAGATLDPLLAAGPTAWRAVREHVVAHLTDPAAERPLTPVAEVEMVLPFTVGDYVDFFSSIHHATNLGRILRPGEVPLLPNWRHLPVGYHGRAGTVAVSGTPVRRPSGLVGVDGGVVRRPTAALDFELEVGFVVGAGNEPGRGVEPDRADEHVFGVVLVDDWSARDIQAYEYRPLGPFLAKSFLTTVSPWVVPLTALADRLVAPPAQDPPVDPHLRARRPWGLDVDLAVHLNGTTIARTNLAGLYWTFAQQLAHLTSNGATVRAGDLFATGTVSGPTAGERGSLIEATWLGRDPIHLADGTDRVWLLDGDTVSVSGWCPGSAGRPPLDLGSASGTVVPATAPRPAPRTRTQAASSTAPDPVARS